MENTFKKEIDLLLKKNGRKLNWVIEQTNCPAREFYSLIKINGFNAAQKITIKAIITGKKIAIPPHKIELI